jgi:TATA-box binding protein (TBP) (component of TFIID and TFIIIB)
MDKKSFQKLFKNDFLPLNTFKKMSFQSYKVSTKTFIIYTNLVLKLEKIFESKIFPISKYIVVQKKRGRRKKIQEEDPNKNIEDGSIIQIKFKSQHKGVLLKKKSEKGGFFRNSMTFVMIIDDKIINFKISRNGKFQMTGCKLDDQAEKCVSYFWNYLEKNTDYYSFSEGNNLYAYYEPVMYNIDFSLGFEINRENLDYYINTKTSHTSLLETTAGYTGVNIKIKVDTDFSKLFIKKVDYISNSIPVVSYINYVSLLEKFDSSKLKETKYNTFLVFQSGKTIMSGKTDIFMEKSYYEFINIIKKCSSFIKEAKYD